MLYPELELVLNTIILAFEVFPSHTKDMSKRNHLGLG